MLKFKVLVTSDATVSTYVDVVVEADDIEEGETAKQAAERMALDEARDNPSAFEWTHDDGNMLDPYLADPGNCAEEMRDADVA